MELIIEGREQVERQQDNDGRDDEDDWLVLGARANHGVSRISRGRSRLESVGSPFFLSPIAMLGERKVAIDGAQTRSKIVNRDGKRVIKIKSSDRAVTIITVNHAARL